MSRLKSSSPKALALLLSIILSSLYIFVLSLYIFNLFENIEKFVFLSFSILFIFTSTFITVFFILTNFIIKRIEPIYKTINAIKIPQKELFENVDDKDIIKELRTEVMTWAKLKTIEIEELKDTEKLRKEFIGNVAHELKTPVFNIQGYVLTLIDGGLDDDEIAKKYLKRTAKNVKRMIAIIKDIDTISRLEDNQLRLNYSEFSISDLINEVIELQEIKQSKYNITIEFEDSSCKNTLVKADREKILEVLNNLVANSLKYGKSGGKTRIKCSIYLNKIYIHVKDNGIGMNKEHLTHIFERFYRVDKSRSRERGGSGLGLSIVKHVIEAHQEQIVVESKEGKGTEFKFSLQKIDTISNHLRNE